MPFHLLRNTCNDRKVLVPIEPLMGFLRHPYFHCFMNRQMPGHPSRLIKTTPMLRWPHPKVPRWGHFENDGYMLNKVSTWYQRWSIFECNFT